MSLQLNHVSDTITSSTGSGALVGFPINGFKNRIINGAMMIDQRYAGAATANTISGYTVDRWGVYQGTTGKLIAQQNSGSVATPAGFTKYLGVTSQSAYSALSTDTYAIQQWIEGYNIADLGFGTSSAKTVTLYFQVYSSLTGTFCGCLAGYNGSTFRSYPFTYTVSSANTWTSISVTIAGDTTSFAYNTTNGNGLMVGFDLGSGSNYQGTANTWQSGLMYASSGATKVIGTNGATFYITGVQLEKGSTATSFDYRPYGTELALCQRYYEKSFDMGTAPAQNIGNYNGAAVASSPGQLSGMTFGDTRFKISKRAIPTVTFFNPGAANAFARDQNAGVNCSATSAWVVGESSMGITASTGSGSGITNRVGVHWTAESEL